MRIERLEAEVKEPFQRVSKLEARSETAAGRLAKSKRAHRPSGLPFSQGPPTEPDLEGWPGLETIEFRSTAAFERDLA